MRHPGPAQRGELQLHRALLAALDAVAVVDDQDAHPPGYAIRPMDPPAVTVVVPTRGRAAYLEVTLRSLLAQRTGTAHELLVVDDGSADDTRAVAARLEVRCVSHGEPRSLNAARNTGLRESGAPLVAFVDDDVLAPPGWLEALAEGARAHPAAEAFGGPIRARIEGGGPRGCGREEPPITALDLGPEDREADMVWGANFAVRRSAVERIGPFDERIVRPHGDEEEWLERLRAAGGRIVYLAAAGLDHRRSAEDARLRRAGARRLRARAGGAGQRPAPRPRARPRRRAARAGRLRLAHRAARLPAGRGDGRARGRPGGGGAAPAAGARGQAAVSHDFLSGDAGDVTHPWRRLKRGLGELGYDALDRAALTGRRMDRLAAAQAAAARAGGGRVPARLAAAGGASSARLRAPRGAAGLRRGGRAGAASWRSTRCCRGLEGGKFENLNQLLAAAPVTPSRDWMLVIDDDLRLPPRFLDRFVALCERFALDLAQPAQTLRSPLGLEGGPAPAAVAGARDALRGDRPAHGLRAAAAAELLPFPELRFGWGLDLHWAALAAERGWRLGRGRRAAGPTRGRGWWPPTTPATTRSPRPPASWPTAPTSRAPAPATRWPCTGGR